MKIKAELEITPEEALQLMQNPSYEWLKEPVQHSITGASQELFKSMSAWWPNAIKEGK